MRLNTRIFSSVSTKSLVFGFVIVMACLAFVFTGFGRLNPGDLFGLDPSTAAKVGSEKIDMQLFSAFISPRITADTPPDQRRMLVQQVLNQMVQQKILEEQAKKIGWFASDSEMAVLIKNEPQFQNPQTKQFDLQLFKNMIASQQMSELSFYAYLKQQLEVQKMQNLLYMPVAIPNKLAEAQNKINNTEFNLQYAVVSVPDSTLKSKIAEQAKNFANDKANLTNLNELFEKSKNQFQQKAQVKALSILISYKTAQRAQGDALKRTQDEAKKLVEQIESKLKSGSDFSKLASETNDDLPAKNNKGNIGFVDETNIDPKSAQAVLALTAQNNLSGVIDTPFGYRIFKYVEGKPAISKSFEDVKVQLAEQMLGNQIKQTVETELQKNINDALAAKDLSKLNTLLSESHISWQYIAKLYKASDTFINELGMASSLAQNIFTLKNPGDTIPKIIDFGTKKAIIKLVSKNLPKSTPDQINSLSKQMMAQASQEFATSAQQSFTKSYEKSDKIKINPVLLN